MQAVQQKDARNLQFRGGSADSTQKLYEPRVNSNTLIEIKLFFFSFLIDKVFFIS